MPGGATPVARRLPGLARCQRAIIGLPESGRGGEDAGAVRWMIEGRGVSLIARTVGIPVPVSGQRIQTDLDQPAT